MGTDVVTGINAYYNLQIIEDEKADVWHVWRKWGRVGTRVGSSKIDKFSNVHKAIKLFEKVYLDKTGNKWADRDEFEKQPGKYFPVDIDYGVDESSLKSVDPNKPSQLQDERIKVQSQHTGSTATSR
jgi:poly [ADP-ribose] polymerase